MKKTTKSATVEKAYGNPLPKGPITFEYSYDEYEKGDPLPAVGEDDIRQMLNARENAKARAEKQTEVLEAAGIKKPDLKDPAFRMANMIKILVANGETPENAEKLAKQLLAKQAK